MAFLIDTSVLGRLANKADIQFPFADGAVARLRARGEILHITAQNLVEFRNAATRPRALNGLGMSIQDAETESAGFERLFPLLAETADIFPAWKALVGATKVIGKQVHDARLVAVCHVHKVTHLLTLNTTHFAALAAYGPGVTIVDPATV
jgi:predicted nucleic acid-binding protein